MRARTHECGGQGGRVLAPCLHSRIAPAVSFWSRPCHRAPPPPPALLSDHNRGTLLLMMHPMQTHARTHARTNTWLFKCLAPVKHSITYNRIDLHQSIMWMRCSCVQLRQPKDCCSANGSRAQRFAPTSLTVHRLLLCRCVRPAHMPYQCKSAAYVHISPRSGSVCLVIDATPCHTGGTTPCGQVQCAFHRALNI